MLALNSHYLECFVAAAETGTFNKAAKKLGKSPSTVSRWINELEESLDYLLFDRKSNGLVVVLSEKGEVLLPKAKIAIDYLTKFEHIAMSIHDNTTPLSLIVSFSELVDVNGVAEIVSDLKNTFQQLQISLRNIDLSHVQLALDNKDVDFALGQITDSLYPSVGGIPVGNENVKLIAHPDNKLTKQVQVSTDMLLGQTAIWSSPYEKTERHQAALFNSLEILECSDLNTVVALVKQNLGIALLPEYVAHDAIKRKEVVALDLHDREVDKSIQLMLYYRLDYPYPDIIEQLATTLQDWFGYVEK